MGPREGDRIPKLKQQDVLDAQQPQDTKDEGREIAGPMGHLTFVMRKLRQNWNSFHGAEVGGWAVRD